MSKVADESSGSGGEEASSWNMGQDDSVVHGKHLPPSPRRQLNKSSLKMAKTVAAPAAGPVSPAPPAKGAKPAQLQLHQPSSGRRPGDRRSCSPSVFQQDAHTASSPTSYCRARTTSESLVGLEPPQAPNASASTSILRRKVLSKETVKQYQEKALQRQGSRGQQQDPGRSRACPSAMQIPWEKEVEVQVQVEVGVGQTGIRQDRGLLEEIESACALGSALSSSQAPSHRP